MTVLPDAEAERISDQVDRSDRAALVRWVRALLEDRRARSALILSLSRQLHHTRRRLAQAASYLDGLLAKAHAATRQPWPKQEVCERCGAPANSAKAVPEKPTGHRILTGHPDGTACHEDKDAEKRADR
jgi:hypothetical protein